MLKLTYNAHGANLSDTDGYVTHEMIRPMFGREDSGWTLYELTGPYSKRHVGSFESPEAAKAAAEKGGK